MPCDKYDRRYKELRAKGFSKKRAKRMAGASVYGHKKKKYYGLHEGWVFRP